ncbi:MAG TPA: FAD binding domain-containing protein, partial [Bauldia sp.]|nr:FAD binding domain-containing protein [Bauldia sp.]
MRSFDYHRPPTAAEAVTLLSGLADARPIAGGMTLLPTMKQRLAAPAALVDLSAIDGLSAIVVSGGTVTIGAMTPHATVAASAEV